MPDCNAATAPSISLRTILPKLVSSSATADSLNTNWSVNPKVAPLQQHDADGSRGHHTGTASSGRSSATDLTGLDAIIKRLVERDECLALRMVEIENVSGRGGIVSLARQIRLRVFESAGHFHLTPDAQK